MKNQILLKLALISSLALSLQAEYTRDVTKNVVTDSASGLMWQDDSDAKIMTKTWVDAINYCEAKELGGYDDWRLPNHNELYNLSDRSRFSPAISPVFTHVKLESYWSSTTDVSDSRYIFGVNFNDGDDDWCYKTNSYYVRCVRAGQ